MAVPPLRALVEAGHDIALCVTRPDRRRGRGKERRRARSRRRRPSSASRSAMTWTTSWPPASSWRSWWPSAASSRHGSWTQIPMVNLHFSLLPRWRGAAPVERAILAGDRETGVCLMKVEEGLDTGPVYAVRTVPLDDDITLDALRLRVGRRGQRAGGGLAGPRGGRSARPRAAGGRGHPGGQNHQGGPPPRLARPAVELRRVVRLGRAWTTFRGKRLDGARRPRPGPDEPDAEPAPPGCCTVPSSRRAPGACVLEQVQPESRSPMSAEEWLRGVRPAAGERLGTD